MNIVTVSPKFQIVIPKTVREKMKIESGEKLQVFTYNGRIELVRIQDLKKMRGCLKGMTSDVEREGDRL